MCHLGISSSNVMLRTDDFEAWDQLRLIDFGFSQFCEPGMTVQLNSHIRQRNNGCLFCMQGDAFGLSKASHQPCLMPHGMAETVMA